MPTDYSRIPAELRALNQWCCWKLEDRGGTKPTKLPYMPNGNRASVTNQATWSSFDKCVGALADARFDGIGYIFAESDPFCGVDLDFTTDEQHRAVHTNVWQHIQSYTEISPSGRGYHIIVRGSVPTGKRRMSTEIYSSARFFTMSANIIRDLPIADYQDKLDILWAEMGGKVAPYEETEDGEQLRTDDELIITATRASNGDKFAKLSAGDFGAYPSQSEADQAWCNMLAYYTDSKTQVARIFLSSPLGQRDKAHKHPSYLRNTIHKAFDQKLPKVDISAVENALANLVKTPKPNKEPTYTPIPWPPGLIGEIADYIYRQAPRPVSDIALVGALGLIAGICGQAYNVSNTGLNQYFIMIAPTGRGKEAIASGINKLMSRVTALVPYSDNFIGPSDMASGVGLRGWLEDHSCFVSVMGEIGIRLKSLCSPNAPAHESDLKGLLLDLYNKSGFNDVLKPKAYSRNTKSKAEHKSVKRPAFTLIGESTPERFFDALDDNLISDGFMPRFCVVQYEGERGYLSKDHASAVPFDSTVNKLAEIASRCLEYGQTENVQHIKFDPKAELMMDEFDRKTSDIINDPATKAALNELYNRAHMKALKIAGLLAVGENYFFPTVTSDIAEWAIMFVMRDINNMVYRFTHGETSAKREGNQMLHVDAITGVLKDWFSGAANGKTYGLTEAMVKSGAFMSSSLNIRLQSVKVFKDEKIGVPKAIKDALKIMEEAGTIQEISKVQTKERFAKTALMYQIVDVESLTAKVG